jgi:hypothetical protein
VSLVMANWESVLGVIRMASMKVLTPKEENGDAEERKGDELPLPVPLVRIPVQQSDGAQ